MAFRIFRHALRMVFWDFWAALRVSTPILIVIFVATLGLGQGILTTSFGIEAEEFSSSMFLSVLLFLLLYLVATLWTAVAWHRYALLAETPGTILPRFDLPRILAYLGKSVILVLIGVGVVVCATLVLFLMSLLGTFGAVLGGTVSFFVYLALMITLMRLTIILPAAAVGRPLTLREAYDATRPIFWQIILTFVISAVFFILLSVFASVMPLLLGSVIQLALFWLQTMVSLSIITSLYGIAIEHRDID